VSFVLEERRGGRGEVGQRGGDGERESTI